MKSEKTVIPRYKESLIPIPYEPKLNNRWLVNFPEDIGVPNYLLASSSRPSFTIKNNEIICEPIDMTFNDAIGPSMAQRFYALMDITRFKGFGIIDKIKSLFGFKKLPIYDRNLLKYRNGIDYTLELLDPTGVTIEKWKITGCQLKSIEFGSLRYGFNQTDALVKINVVIKPKNAILLY